MKSIPIKLKLQVASTGFRRVLRRPRYVILAAVLSVVFLEFIFWLNNLPMLQYILTVPTLSLAVKMQFLASTYTSVWQSSSSPLAISLLVLSLIQGATLSILIYIVRHQRADTAALKAVGNSSLASILATLGLGCAACGTSLITPILVLLFSSSSIVLAERVGAIVTVAGMVAGLYALYSISLRAASIPLGE